MTKLLELHKISKYYEEDLILSEISLSVNKGTAIAITGNSGGGKTTLLSIMGLLQTPTSGQIFVNGIEVSALEQEKQAKIRGKYFGFVFQRARLISSLTVLENVVLPAWFTKKEKGIAERAQELLTHFGLEHRLNHKPQQLSLGQLRRVSLARALLLQPPLLLADEPTNDLDPVLAEIVANALFQARDQGAGVIIVTHDSVLANRADTIFKLDEGNLIQVK
ncbi:ABC transporter ATP-binding protein [Sporomusaceae bacterium FL31]|nr:ABC transporter ATP-binding protein [Sporomusaceae bacterium FL31]GCE32268.1 ABC transporter ATP-binding protein [Sporomusaceae bacterium]